MTASASATRSLIAILLLGLLLGAVPIAAQLPSNTPLPETTDHIRGVVLSSLDKKPIARALVTSADQRYAALTDSEGRFAFDLRHPVPPASNNAGYRAPGIQFANVTLNLTKPGYLRRNANLRIDYATLNTPLQLTLTPEAVIRGRVYPSGGELPNFLQVQLRRKQVQDGTATWVPAGGVNVNPHGDFRFSDLQSGDYKVMTTSWTGPTGEPNHAAASVTGYPPTFQADALDLCSAPVLHVAPGQTGEANLTLRATTFYRVTVPIANVPERSGVGVLLGPDERADGYFLNFNFQAHRVQGYLPTGAYTVRVTVNGPTPNDGLRTATAPLNVASAPVAAQPVTLQSGPTIPILVRKEFTAQTQSTGPPVISVRMGQLNGPSLNLTLQPIGVNGTAANSQARPNSGDEGLALKGVAEGSYRAVIFPNRGYVASMTSNGVDLLHQLLVVRPGTTDAPIEVTLRDDAATLTGSIAAQTPLQPATQQWVYFIRTDLPFAQFLAETGAFVVNGRFTAGNLAPGEYLVLASTSQPLAAEYRNPEVLRDLKTKGTLVTLAPGQKADIQVPLLASPDEAN
jgi:hypothetical protein